MKNKFLPVIFSGMVFCLQNSFAQQGEWVWLHGSNAVNGAVNYGIQGVPSPANVPPSVYEPAEWRDLSGNFWLYGGVGGMGFYADLWKYDPGSNEWTWVKGPGTLGYNGSYGVQGVSSPSNNPPAKSYGSTTWTDAAGNLWIYAGLNNSSPGSDLWMYNISINEWTWINGSNTTGLVAVYGTQGIPSILNTPGDRWECSSSWTDGSGDLWLFGGYLGAGSLNDLWRYNVTANEWTWMKGANFPGASGIWGIRTVEAAANDPSARGSYTHWLDGTGNFWVFGGYDFSGSDNYNDLWRYNPSTNNWTWMHGSQAGNAAGTYGTQCGDDSLNTPGARYESRTVWTDSFGNFWLMGGRNCCGPTDMWNDLWTYCTATNRWTWVSGNNTANPSGSWGMIGVSDPANHPNARCGAISWMGANGQLYFFGGSTFPYMTPYNDLWKHTVDYSCVNCSVLPVAIFTSPNHICPGTCTDFTNLSINGTSFQWIFPGASPGTSMDVDPQGICYANPGTYDVTLIATNANGSDTLTLPNYITVYPHPAPQGIIQSGDTLFANAGAITYQWYFDGTLIPGATDYYYVASQSGNYNVVAADANGCEVEAVIFDVVASLTQAFSGGAEVTLFPNPVSEKLTIYYPASLGPAIKISVYNIIGERLLYSQPAIANRESGISVDVHMLANGLYWLELSADEIRVRLKFIKH